MSDFFKKLWANVYIKNIVAAIGVIVFLLILSSLFLNMFTRHGESEPVPNFAGKTLDSVKIIAKKANLRIEITDTVYRIDAPRGAVYAQNPESGIHVKKNRKIFLTMNSPVPKKEPLPDVEGHSLRQAKTVLYAKGFRVGNLTFVNDYATNNVLQQTYKGKKAEPGIWLPVGEYIDLQLGLDSAYISSFQIPNVTGLTKLSVEDAIIESSLNYSLAFDKGIRTITDSLNAVAYKQEPPAGTHTYYGNNVKVYLKQSPKK